MNETIFKDTILNFDEDSVMMVSFVGWVLESGQPIYLRFFKQIGDCHYHINGFGGYTLTRQSCWLTGERDSYYVKGCSGRLYGRFV